MIRREIAHIAEAAAKVYAQADGCPAKHPNRNRFCCVESGNPAQVADFIVQELVTRLYNDGHDEAAELLIARYDGAKDGESYT